MRGLKKFKVFYFLGGDHQGIKVWALNNGKE